MPSLYSSTLGKCRFDPLRNSPAILANLHLLILLIVQFQTVASKPTTIQPKIDLEDNDSDAFSKTLEQNLPISREKDFRFIQRFIETQIKNKENKLEPPKKYKESYVAKENLEGKRRRKIRSITDPFSTLSKDEHKPNTDNKDGNILGNVKNTLSSLFSSTKEKKLSKSNTEQNFKNMNETDAGIQVIKDKSLSTSVIDKLEGNSKLNSPKYSVDSTNTQSNSNNQLKSTLQNKNEQNININDSAKITSNTNSSANNNSSYETKNNNTAKGENNLKFSEDSTSELSSFKADKDKTQNSQIIGAFNGTINNINKSRNETISSIQQNADQNEQFSTSSNQNMSKIKENVNNETIPAKTKVNEGNETRTEDISYEKVDLKSGINNRISNGNDTKIHTDDGMIGNKSTTNNSYSLSNKNSSKIDNLVPKDTQNNPVEKSNNQSLQGTETTVNGNSDASLKPSNLSDLKNSQMNSITSGVNKTKDQKTATNETLPYTASSDSSSVKPTNTSENKYDPNLNRGSGDNQSYQKTPTDETIPNPASSDSASVKPTNPIDLNRDSEDNQTNDHQKIATNSTIPYSASVKPINLIGNKLNLDSNRDSTNNSTSKLGSIAEGVGSLPPTATSSSGIKNEATATTKPDNNSKENKNSKTRDSNSDLVKDSAVPDQTAPTLSSSTSNNMSQPSKYASTLPSDTKAFDKLPTTAKGYNESSAKSNNSELINDNTSSHKISNPVNEKKQPINFSTSSNDINSPSITETASNKSSRTKIDQPNTIQGQPSSGKKKAAPANTTTHDNIKNTAQNTSTQLDKEKKNEVNISNLSKMNPEFSRGENQTNAGRIGSGVDAPINILSLNQTKGVPKSDNQVIGSSNSSTAKDMPGNNSKAPPDSNGILDIPYTNDVSEEDDTNDTNSEDIGGTDDDIVIMTETTETDSKTERTTKGDITPSQTSKISPDETRTQHSTESPNKTTNSKIDAEKPATESELSFLQTTSNPKTGNIPTNKNTVPDKTGTTEKKSDATDEIQSKTTVNSDHNGSETTENSEPEESKDCENENNLSGILGSALHYGALAGSAGAIGAMLPQILNMLKDLFKKDGEDDAQNKEDNDNNTGNTENQTQENTNQECQEQPQNTTSQPENTQNFLEKELAEAEDEILNEIDDKIDGIEDSVMDTIKGKLTEVEDGIVGDLKDQILHGGGSILQNAKAAFAGGENNLLQNIKGRLKDAKDDLLADVKGSFKSEIRNSRDALNLKKGGNSIDKNQRTDIQLLFINEKVTTRRISWPTTRNDYLGKTNSVESIDAKQITKTDETNSNKNENINNEQFEDNDLNPINQDVPRVSFKTSNVVDLFKKFTKK